MITNMEVILPNIYYNIPLILHPRPSSLQVSESEWHLSMSLHIYTNITDYPPYMFYLMFLVKMHYNESRKTYHWVYNLDAISNSILDYILWISARILLPLITLVMLILGSRSRLDAKIIVCFVSNLKSFTDKHHTVNTKRECCTNVHSFCFKRLLL